MSKLKQHARLNAWISLIHTLHLIGDLMNSHYKKCDSITHFWSVQEKIVSWSVIGHSNLNDLITALARVLVPNRPPGSSSFRLLKQLHWLPVEWRIKFKIATLTFKVLETGLPPYLSQQLCPYVPTRGLRSSSSKLLQVPRTNLRFGSRSFRVSAPTIWNSIPLSVRSCESLTTFRKHLKTFYFQSAFPDAP